jgi:hypothetical protein
MSFFKKVWSQLKTRRSAPVSDLILVSGSDSSHAKSLLQWFKSAIEHEPDSDIVIYDLGLTPEQKNNFRHSKNATFDWISEPFISKIIRHTLI